VELWVVPPTPGEHGPAEPLREPLADTLLQYPIKIAAIPAENLIRAIPRERDRHMLPRHPRQVQHRYRRRVRERLIIMFDQRRQDLMNLRSARLLPMVRPVPLGYHSRVPGFIERLAREADRERLPPAP